MLFFSFFLINTIKRKLKTPTENILFEILYFIIINTQTEASFCEFSSEKLQNLRNNAFLQIIFYIFPAYI